jgi:hypothetical protein
VEELLGLIFGLFDAFAKRSDRRANLGSVLRAALAERIAAVPKAAPSRAIPLAEAVAVRPADLPPRRPAPAVLPSPEAGLVTGLFANPQSLVAAFIVAEVLAKPVALRDQ